MTFPVLIQNTTCVSELTFIFFGTTQKTFNEDGVLFQILTSKIWAQQNSISRFGIIILVLVFGKIWTSHLRIFPKYAPPPLWGMTKFYDITKVGLWSQSTESRMWNSNLNYSECANYWACYKEYSKLFRMFYLLSLLQRI